MNAPNPSSTDRDLESLRRAQRAHEPSMEEILASIRSIIADDREPAAPPAAKPVSPGGPQIVYSNSAAPAPRPTAPETAAPAAASSPKVVWEKPAPGAEPAPAVEAAPAAVTAEPEPEREPVAASSEEEPFSSPDTEAAVAASFKALAATVQNSAMIESMTREMLRPMLKSWLDDNLPTIVERLVRAEIQRVARGGH